MPYRAIKDPVQLRRLLEATMLLESDLDLPSLLTHIVDQARSMTGARYGALGVLDADQTALAEFVTSGLTDEVEGRIGARPTGQGVLGVLITDPHPIRLSAIDEHPESFGFPPGHPDMRSFLGVPVTVRGEIYGNLYLTEKEGWGEFTQDDETLIQALSVVAGIAIEAARLHERVKYSAVLEERDRIARDLHDAVIQRLFATGLQLEGTLGSVSDRRVRERLRAAISDINDTIHEIRSSIFQLGVEAVHEQSVRARALAVVRELEPSVGVKVTVSLDGPIDTTVSSAVAEHLLVTIREALTNVGRHARATEVRLSLFANDQVCRLTVRDNGRGFADLSAPDRGLGLTNLRRRAEKLDGALSVESPDEGGTVLVWEVPIAP